ncbi:MAG: hypothetical protein ACK4PR_00415, partial [Gammaproteobacteria bacterium]
MELRQFISKNNEAPDIINKINLSLLEQGYSAFAVSIFATIICATVILLGLYNIPNRTVLWCWYIFAMSLTLVRIAIVLGFKFSTIPEKLYRWWRNKFNISAILS